MTINDITALPPADAEQLHLVDEIQHEDEYRAIHSREFAARCGECGQPLPQDGAR